MQYIIECKPIQSAVFKSAVCIAIFIQQYMKSLKELMHLVLSFNFIKFSVNENNFLYSIANQHVMN
jgi:hypothetical protein